MSATFFIVRSVVEPHLREKLEHWYANDHLPWALRVFKCEKAWRCWSARDEGVHYAIYRFTDKASCDAALGSPEYKEMVADYDRAFPSVLRTRDVVTLADERNV
jgi:hypothetical protein